ncbi:MAG: hypothetical protein H7840_01920 [Alphaproteobacteria bacterium]
MAINITLGSLALVGGGLYPFAHEAMSRNSATIGAEMLVNEVVKRQRAANADKATDKITYVYFPSTEPGRGVGLSTLGVSSPTGDYTVEAFRDKEAVLVVRAYSKPEAIRKGDVAAVMYEHRIKIAGEDGTGRWVVAP